MQAPIKGVSGKGMNHDDFTYLKRLMEQFNEYKRYIARVDKLENDIISDRIKINKMIKKIEGIVRSDLVIGSKTNDGKERLVQSIHKYIYSHYNPPVQLDDLHDTIYHFISCIDEYEKIDKNYKNMDSKFAHPLYLIDNYTYYGITVRDDPINGYNISSHKSRYRISYGENSSRDPLGKSVDIYSIDEYKDITSSSRKKRENISRDMIKNKYLVALELINIVKRYR